MKNSRLHASIPLLALLAACGGSTHGGSSPPVNNGPNPLYEIEPNDFVEDADYLGQIRGGDYIAIEGHIQECCGVNYNCCSDLYDGFALYAAEPVSVLMTLTEYTPGTDLDFAIYLPSINDVVDAFETPNHPEVGVFNLDGIGEFHIVINSWIGDADYILEIDVQPLYAAGATDDGAAPQVDEVSASQRSRQRFERYFQADPQVAQEPPLRVVPRERGPQDSPPGRADED